MMRIFVKLIISIVFVFLGLLLTGLTAKISLNLSLAVLISVIIGVYAVWKKRRVKGEGDIFKDGSKLNKNLNA